MKRTALLARTLGISLLVLALLLATSGPATAGSGTDLKDKDNGYQTAFVDWRGSEGGFTGWTRGDPAVSAGTGLLVFDPAAAVGGIDPYAAGAYYGGNYYNGGTYQVDEVTGPVLESAFALKEAIASWNAETPTGTWIETQIRARSGGRWTKWYSLGIWASGTETIQRHSVRLQGDADGYVAVDTLVLSKKLKVSADALQLKVLLFSEDGVAVPQVSYMSLAYSSELVKNSSPETGNPYLWNTLLAVPECSQMVYPDGGEVWCSPTSTSMVLGYYGDSGDTCAERVTKAVAGVYDWIYDGHGNWPFNTAYAATYGHESSVRRYTSLADLEQWVKDGVPVVMSIAWGKGDLTNAPIPSSNGHLVVLVGFDGSGNPIVNDPAAATDEEVQRTYIRSELEAAWLDNSGGTVYIIQ